MSDKIISVSKKDEHLRGILEMFSSLLFEVERCGGCVSCYTWERLNEMTAAKLIETLGPNKARFTSAS